MVVESQRTTIGFGNRKAKVGQIVTTEIDRGRMKFIFVDESWEDYLYWQKTDKKKLKRINDLIKDIARNPFDGIGKPEPLKFKYSGFWSRRIDDEHRLVYQVKDDEILIAKCRFHYD
jgi:toxin YoeB